MKNMQEKKYQVIAKEIEMTGNICKMPHEKLCKNGTNMGMLTIVFYDVEEDKMHGYEKMVKKYQNVTFFDEDLIEQSKNFVKGEFIRIKGTLKKFDEEKTALLQASAIKSLCLPKHPWA